MNEGSQKESKHIAPTNESEPCNSLEIFLTDKGSIKQNERQVLLKEIDDQLKRKRCRNFLRKFNSKSHEPTELSKHITSDWLEMRSKTPARALFGVISNWKQATSNTGDKSDTVTPRFKDLKSKQISFLDPTMFICENALD